ncbi:uncharacterized protein LOC126375313 [Pectinophora gossypiella]|uniref:uncharacterized protein LOC126375313 n=1 Tax=Pectinophora gossypiella TaxID=13191 RepID=UPI00214DF578|nr:uncharacterized protein LOC126375313 [Pectinophora gossypiella]
MHQETVVHSRPDREIRKKIITPGDYTIVPYEDSRCKVVITDVICTNEDGKIEIDPDSVAFSPSFDGNMLIGDLDNFIDKDFELLLQQMCSGETCSAIFVYRDSDKKLVKEISCTVELKEVMEEQVISDWSWQRLYEAAVHHKEKGVLLVKDKKIVQAFRRFSKALKFLVAVEPVDPNEVDDVMMRDMKELKVKLLSNLAHCQLQFNEYEAALELCNRALKLEPDNIKVLYRRSLAHTGLKLFEEAWRDIQAVLQLDPNDKAARQKANALKPIIEKINKEYESVIKKMFV